MRVKADALRFSILLLACGNVADRTRKDDAGYLEILACVIVVTYSRRVLRLLLQLLYQFGDGHNQLRGYTLSYQRKTKRKTKEENRKKPPEQRCERTALEKKEKEKENQKAERIDPLRFPSPCGEIAAGELGCPRVPPELDRLVRPDASDMSRPAYRVPWADSLC